MFVALTPPKANKYGTFVIPPNGVMPPVFICLFNIIIKQQIIIYGGSKCI